MDHSWTAHPSDSSKKTPREHQVRIGMEQRSGRAVMSQHKPRLTPCPVLFWAPQPRQEIIPWGRGQRRSLRVMSCWLRVRNFSELGLPSLAQREAGEDPLTLTTPLKYQNQGASTTAQVGQVQEKLRGFPCHSLWVLSAVTQMTAMVINFFMD